jgi:membrane protease YdiL (CAAX protease family)
MSSFNPCKANTRGGRIVVMFSFPNDFQQRIPQTRRGQWTSSVIVRILLASALYGEGLKAYSEQAPVSAPIADGKNQPVGQGQNGKPPEETSLKDKTPVNEGTLSQDNPPEPHSNPPDSWTRQLPLPVSFALIPVASGVLPGLGQWIYGEYTAGALYSGAGYAAFRYHHFQAKRLDFGTGEFGVESKDPVYRRYLLGRLLQQGIGGLSLYDSFRTAVLARHQDGFFDFYQKPDRVQDILKAPFAFRNLLRLSTALPLGVGAALHLWAHRNLPQDSTKSRERLDSSDLFFSGAISFNAGTHEEAVFRGWMLPMFYESFGQLSAANVLQALLFGIAHRNTISLPIFQTLAGYYLGSLVIEDQFSLEQAVFLHTWWDVIAIASSYSYRSKSGNLEAMAPFVITPIQIVF